MLKDTGNKRTKNADHDSSGRPEFFLFPFSPNLLVVFMFLLTDQQMQGTQLIDQIQTATMFSTMEMKQQDTVERKL